MSQAVHDLSSYIDYKWLGKSILTFPISPQCLKQIFIYNQFSVNNLNKCQLTCLFKLYFGNSQSFKDSLNAALTRIHEIENCKETADIIRTNL